MSAPLKKNWRDFRNSHLEKVFHFRYALAKNLSLSVYSAGLSVQQIAEHIGLEPNYLARILAGKYVPPFDLYVCIELAIKELLFDSVFEEDVL